MKLTSSFFFGDEKFCECSGWQTKEAFCTMKRRLEKLLFRLFNRGTCDETNNRNSFGAMEFLGFSAGPISQQAANKCGGIWGQCHKL
jgi:hypothetical protein